MVENPVPEEPLSDRRKILTIIQVIVIALIGKLVLESFLVQAFLVQSNSMEDFLLPGDRIFVNRTYPEFGVISRGDVIVLNSPGEQGLIVKRIVAMPNEVIVVSNGDVMVNGTRLDEEYLAARKKTPAHPDHSRVFNKIEPGIQTRIPDDCFFVMGDNRSVSRDSRYFGWISRKNIIGKAVMVFFPPKRLRMI